MTQPPAWVGRIGTGIRTALAAALFLFCVAAMPSTCVAQEDGVVLETHSVPAERRATVEQWRRQLPVQYRTIWDEQAGRLLLYAPLETHAELLQLLSKPVAATPGVLNPESAAKQLTLSPTGSTSAEGGLRVRQLTPTELHARLQTLARRPLPATWDPERTTLSFPLSLRGGVEVSVKVDSQSGEVRFEGQRSAIGAWSDVIRAIDASASIGSPDGEAVRIVSTQEAPVERVRSALRVLQASNPGREAAAGGQPDPVRVAQAPNTAPGRPPALETDVAAAGGVLGPVDIEFVEGLDVIVLRGDPEDIDRVTSVIEQIERLSMETTPRIEVKTLRHVGSRALAELLQRVYTQAIGPRAGEVNITALGQPNALLLIGRDENVRLALGLIDQLDQPVEPTSKFEVFALKHASAVDAKELIDDYLAQQQSEDNQASNLAPRAFVVADYRNNMLVVSASPRDLQEVRTLLKSIDAARGDAIDEVRVFPLRNALAEDLAEVLEDAIAPAEDAGGDDGATARPSALRLRGTGLESSVLTGVRVAADTRANAVVVTAPAESMELLAALVEQLDRAPDASAELKVFSVANGDAVALAEMLRALFGSEEEDEDAGRYGSGGLSPLTVTVDERTNSILAAGSADDLAVVEAILLRLDDSETRERNTTVYRMKNARALDVATALNEWLQNERDAEANAELTFSAFEQIDREVIVVAEDVSNSLIVSASPRYEDEIRELVEQLDERPPMVMIQVLIAEVGLNDTDEFGVELGLQDSLLFDRSLLSEIERITTTVNEQSPGGATISTTQDTIISSDLTPGFNFNNQPLGNNGSTQALARAGNIGAQALSNFALSRVNSELDFGGFVFSASSSNLSFLLRALQENRRVEVLSRPQIMTLDGNEGVAQVGSRVPRITQSTLNNFGQTQNSYVYEDVGLILRVRPRISPDGQIVMDVYIEKSEVGEEEDGIAISVSATGEVVRAPQIETTQAQTVVSATSGQTVVLSGLLTKRTVDIHRRVPLLADIPLLGDLFRYDGVEESRSELLIIMTPRVIHTETDSEMLKQVESARMSWVMSDVIGLHGPAGLRTRNDEWCESEACFPTYVPTEQELSFPDGTTVYPSEPYSAQESDHDEHQSGGVEPVSYSTGVEAPRRLPMSRQ